MCSTYTYVQVAISPIKDNRFLVDIVCMYSDMCVHTCMYMCGRKLLTVE